MSAGSKLKTELTKEQVTCESALRDLGIDETFVMERLKEKLEAKYRRWDPKKKFCRILDDYPIQLAALRELAKISGAHLPRKRDDDKGQTVFVTAKPRDGRERDERWDARD